MSSTFRFPDWVFGGRPEDDWKRQLRQATVRLCALGSCAGALLTLTGFAGACSYWLELTAHFRPFYLVGLLVTTAALCALRAWWWAAPGLAGLLINFVVILPWYLPGPTGDQVEPNLRVALSNVQTGNRQYQKVIDWVHREEPDLLIVQEVNEEWMKHLDALVTEYPHVVAEPREDNFGMAAFSKIPLENTRIETFGDVPVPVITADIGVNGGLVHVIALHTIPPGSERSQRRDGQLMDAAEHARSQRLCLLIGDLNTTMWPPIHAAVEQVSGLRNTRRGFGIVPTWPANRNPIMIPLDHCLCSPALGVVACRRGPDVNSDHFPMLFELHVPAAAESATSPLSAPFPPGTPPVQEHEPHPAGS